MSQAHLTEEASGPGCPQDTQPFPLQSSICGPAGVSTDSISVRRGAEQDSRAPWEDAGWRPDIAANPLRREPSLQLD